MKIVWLASYPKSGNTWLRFIVTALLSGREGFPEGGKSMYADVEEYTPDVYLPGFEGGRAAAAAAVAAGRDRVYFKSHDRLGDDGEPLTRTRVCVEGGQTDRAVYLVRNPLDIVASTWNHVCIEDVERAPAFEDLLRDFSKGGGYRQWAPEYGSWDENVDSWTARPTRFPLMVVRYEDLVADPVGRFGEVARFLGIDDRPERVRAAVEAFSFKRLREREDQMVRGGVFDTEGWRRGHRFFNVGKQGGHASVLTAEQARAVRERFAGTMGRFGY